MKATLLISLIIVSSIAQSVIFKVQPDSTYNQIQASAQACNANCQSCQTNTNQCEECFSPYFTKAQDGSCIFSDQYTLESSNNELRNGDAFAYTTESWNGVNQYDCAPNANYLSSPLRILGPFVSGKTFTYRRTLSFHQYIVIRFLLVKMGWDPTSVLTITIADQNNQVLSVKNITNSPQIPKQILCSSTLSDQRHSVQFQIQDRTTTQIFITFAFSSAIGTGSYGISTWLLMTGFCDSACTNCSFSRDPTQCIGCNQFFIKGSDQKCSQCFTGFKLMTVNGLSICQKCPIEFQVCTPGQQICFYNNITDQLKQSDCTFRTDGDYNATLDVNSGLFPGSLFSVSGKPATYQCGAYSIVGPAQRGDSITRIFANVQPHLFVSISFNIFVIDQYQSVRPNLFAILLDNSILQVTYVNTEAVSDICSNASQQAFVTYPATRFYSHTKQQNVNLTITSNATNWGIRNVRMAYDVCDSTCLTCSSSGCIQCQGLFQLDNLKCSKCPSGYGVLTSSVSASLNTCVQCSQNCLTCVATFLNNQTKTICIQCSRAFFLYQESCILKTNVGGIQSVLGSSDDKNNAVWTNNLLNTDITDTSNTCSLNLPSRNNSTVNFTVTENTMTSRFNIPNPHYKKIVQFYLIKIDSWESTDRLDLYINDLLVLSKEYEAFGNSICFNPSQTDTISFQSLQIYDTNSTLTASFQVVSTSGAVRRFGVAYFRVFPLGCEQCQNYDFNYQINYNYDQALNVHVQFNRVYTSSNQTQFKSIFQLLINGDQLNYDIIWNNSVTYILRSYTNFDSLNSNVTLLCRYPQLVTTDITNNINKNAFFTARQLQTGYSHYKVINNNVSQLTVARYTPVQNWKAVDGVRIFFQVISRMTIYIGFAFFFIGCQTSCTHMMHNLQKIWIHIFVASLAIPSLLKFSLTGFRQIQNQNIAIHPTSWQSGLPSELYYDTPAYYQQYYVDVGFFRNIYNIGVACAILIIFSTAAHFIIKYWCVNRNLSNNIFWRHIKVTFQKRPFFVFNSIFFYQYLTLVLACMLQFLDIDNKTNQGAYGGLNAAGAIVAFIIATAYPIIHFIHLRRKALGLGVDKKIEFTNRYHQIFFRFLPANIWLQEQKTIRYAQRIYNVYRFGQIWWFCIIVTVMHGNPQAQCYLLMITNFLHLLVVLFSSLNYTIYFKFLKVLQLAFFVGLQILILVCQSQQQTLTTRSFNTLGSVGIAFIFAIILFSFIRSIYTFYKIYKQYDNLEPSNDKNNRVNLQTRNQNYYASQIEEPVPTENQQNDNQ